MGSAGGDADAHADRQVVLGEWRVANCVHQAIRGLGRCRGAGLLEEHAELVAAKAGERVLCSEACGHPRRGNLQHVVANVVTAGIIDELEAVQVEVQHRELVAATPCSVFRVTDAIHEQLAVRQARERIVGGLAFEIGPRPFERAGHRVEGVTDATELVVAPDIDSMGQVVRADPDRRAFEQSEPSRDRSARPTGEQARRGDADAEHHQTEEELELLAPAHGGDLVGDLDGAELVEVGEHRDRVVDVVVKRIEGCTGVVAERDLRRLIEHDVDLRPSCADLGDDGDLLLGAEVGEPIEAADEPSTDRAKLLTGGGIVGLDVLLADVIRKCQQIAGLEHPCRLVDRLPLKLLERADRGSEHDNADQGDNDQGHQQGGDGQDQTPGKRPAPNLRF